MSAPVDDKPSTVPPLPPLKAVIVLVVLFIINLGNYTDRYLVNGLQPLIKSEWNVPDARIGLLASSFIVVYMLASPLGGYLSDRVQRRIVIAGAIVLWSIATALASQSPTFDTLLVTRAFVGIGEAGYMAAGSALLADAFRPERRGTVMAIFNAAIPIGAAGGYLLAGALAPEHMTWRGACLVVGLPGIAFAPVAYLALAAPQAPATRESGEGGVGKTLRVYADLLKDGIYASNVLGMAMMTFALGGLATWAVHWLEHRHGLKHDKADFLTGAVVAGSGFVGTVLGAVVASLLSRGGVVRSYAFVTGLGYLLAVPALGYALTLGNEHTSLAIALLFVAMVGAFLGTGPSNAIVAVRAPAAHRASAFALQVFVIHLLGDAFSPPAMGQVADMVRGGDKSGAREAIAYTGALALAPIALALAAIAMFVCFAFARREEKRA